MRKLLVIFLILFVAFGTITSARSVAKQRQASHSEWVAESLAAIETIKVGMTRKDLLKLFTVEGGLSTRTSRTFVFRECPYIKVDVRFEPVGAIEDEDKIVRISKPYLARMVID
jgi:hypothetical protein